MARTGQIEKIPTFARFTAMARHTTLLTIILGCLFTIAGCSKSATKPGSESFGLTPSVAEDKRIASVDVVKAAPEPVEIKAGGSGEVTVRLTIQRGYHVNANPPTYSYLIPTALEIAPTDGVSVGAISYPPPINAKLAFAEKPLAVYEGETQIRATLQADKSAKPGERSLAAKLRIQACDDRVCYPPGTRDLAIPVIIK